MTQYIDKAAVETELQRRLKSYKEEIKKYSPFQHNLVYDIIGKKEECDDILSFIDTLEVKEINSTDAFICKAHKYFYKELPNFRSFMESGTAFIKNFESFIQGE